MRVFKEYSWLYILSVLFTIVFCFIAGETLNCDSPDWLPIGLVGLCLCCIVGAIVLSDQCGSGARLDSRYGCCWVNRSLVFDWTFAAYTSVI